jgi:flagella basal body P-ring formation protein FlgA
MRVALPIAFLLYASAVFAGGRTTIELLPEAKVAGDTVLLGQVARLHSLDLEAMRTLVQLPLGRTPAWGQQGILQQQAVARWIRRHTGLAPEALDWRGVAEARVMRASRQVKGEEIAGAAVRALRAWLSGRGVPAEVHARVLPRDLDVSHDDVRMEARGLENTALRRRMVVWVDVWSAAVFVRTVAVAVELQGPLEDPLSAAHPGVTQPVDSAVRSDVLPPAVARGAWATLRAVAGPVTLESRVEVLQDGQPGQRVRVRQPGGAGLVMARVVGHGELELAP